MCGIAGIVRFDDRPIERERLEVMQGHLGHRGPDGRGIAELGRGALVHTRLSIIDLLSGDQPMAVDPGADRPTMTLVFNGEIYNHRELRHKLESRGHVFHSDHCDTEVLVHGYRAWGTELPKHLHGMYAFAIWDPDARELFLCRDRQGQKPLYIRWHEHAGGRELIFASLIATIMQACPPEERPTIDPVSMMTFLRFGYVTGDSLLKGLKEVPAGHWMKVDANGEATTGRYWQPPPISRTSTRIGVLDATLEVLGEAVEKRLSADVPLGCFLSGGIDSSVVASIAQKVREARGENPIHTFSIAIPEIGYDESHIAREVARAIGSDHAELTATVGDDVFTDLKRLMAISGEPTADSSLLPTLWLSRAARQQVKVALSGDGGDELFGGYDRYRAMRLLHRHRLIAAAVPTGLLPHGRPRSFSSRLRRLAEAARHRTPAAQYHQMIHLFTDEQIAELGALPENAPPPLRDWPDEPNPVSAAMRWDLVHYLPFDLLRKVDRASMSVALEVRCPMLDTQVADLAGHLPERVLMPRGRPKGLLREIAGRLLPGLVAHRRKRGFSIPIGEWFRGPLEAGLADHLFSGSLADLGLDPAPARRWFDEHRNEKADHSHRLFALLELSLWAEWLRDPESAAVPEVDPVA